MRSGVSAAENAEEDDDTGQTCAVRMTVAQTEKIGTSVFRIRIGINNPFGKIFFSKWVIFDQNRPTDVFR